MSGQKGNVSTGKDNGKVYKVAKSDKSSKIPLKLSQTALFKNIKDFSPNNRVYEYQINHPRWLAGKLARHWIYLPEKTKVNTNKDNWKLPKGAVSARLVKEENGKPIEMRLSLIHI